MEIISTIGAAELVILSGVVCLLPLIGMGVIAIGAVSWRKK